MDKEEFELLDDSEKEEGMYLLTVLNSIVDVKVVDKYTTIILRDSIYNNFDLNFEPELVKAYGKTISNLLVTNLTGGFVGVLMYPLEYINS